jgi:hypothetical protein
MRLLLLTVLAILTSVPVAAQEPSTSVSRSGTSSEAAPLVPAGEPSTDLPVSLDRIREGLAQAPEKSLLSTVQRTPDFTVQVEERRRLEEIFEGFDFDAGPVPAGGWYAYEQQRLLNHPVDRPLMQPYAAFSQGELLTVAIENLAINYLGGRLLSAVSDAEREQAEAAARAEVAAAIATYCAVQPNRATITICTNPPLAR